MSYISFAERQGIEKGIEKGRVEGMRANLRAVMEARFGTDGAALVDQLDPQTDQARLDSLARAAATALSLDALLPSFQAHTNP